MKRTIFSVLTAALAASALFVSCEPLEPSTREDTFYRIASVSYKDGDASLLLDYTGESYKFSNFSTKSDMNRFGVQNGDRVIAEITMTAVGTVTNNTLTLNRVIKYPKYALSESLPADSLNYGFRFCSLNLVSVIYPTAWTQGHVLSIAPEYYSSHKGVKPAFKLYPSKVVGDTLMLNLFCDMPDTLTVWDTEQAFVNFDISTLRDQVSDQAEQNHRDSLRKIIDNGEAALLVWHFEVTSIDDEVEADETGMADPVIKDLHVEGLLLLRDAAFQKEPLKYEEEDEEDEEVTEIEEEKEEKVLSR